MLLHAALKLTTENHIGRTSKTIINYVLKHLISKSSSWSEVYILLALSVVCSKCGLIFVKRVKQATSVMSEAAQEQDTAQRFN